MSQPAEIAGYSFDVPPEWFSLPLDGDSSPRHVAHELLAEVESTDTDNFASFVDDVEALVTRLRFENENGSSAAVLVRTEGGLRLGALVVHGVHDLEEDDTPESYEEFARRTLSADRPGRQSLAVQTWQLECPAGPAVGVVHVVTAREPGDADAWVEERAIHGVFVRGTRQLVQFTFTTVDFGAFSDLASETWSIVSTLTVQLEETP